MKKLLIAILVFTLVFAVALPIYGDKKDNSDDAFDNWKGTFVDNPNVNNIYDDATGQVILNYNSGKDEWIVNVVAKGLDPTVKYQVMVYDGSQIILGCGYPNSGGVLHIKARLSKEIIDPTIPVKYGVRVNVRLAEPGEGCIGVQNSAVLSTSINWGGDGLIPVDSNRPE